MGDAERYQILRPLGSDGATFAGRDTAPSAGGRLVVLERVTGAAPKPDERAAAVRRVRALMALSNPRIVHVRDVVERETEVLAVADFADGEWLSAVCAQPPRASEPPGRTSRRATRSRSAPRPTSPRAAAPPADLEGWSRRSRCPIGRPPWRRAA